jgi:hypothetical protein
MNFKPGHFYHLKYIHSEWKDDLIEFVKIGSYLECNLLAHNDAFIVVYHNSIRLIKLDSIKSATEVFEEDFPLYIGWKNLSPKLISLIER